MPCITPKIAYSKIYTIFFSHYSDAELPLKLYVYKIWNGWQQYNRHYNLVVGFTFGPYQPTIEFVFRSRSSPRTFIFNSILVLHIILVLDESLSHYNGLVRRLSSWLNLILQSVNSFFSLIIRLFDVFPFGCPITSWFVSPAVSLSSSCASTSTTMWGNFQRTIHKLLKLRRSLPLAGKLNQYITTFLHVTIHDLPVRHTRPSMRALLYQLSTDSTCLCIWP